ncbi:uncharacterized protein LOC112468264 [Temnothorax curvispinosus]|uniref:Uncharacterized protein LOC112468264 n=1 Tax=Temnothorax curvispinosus TaxID=300111 RepID=A0A6J1RFQ9_9HYME|nr:uncharacterized protein LOC112468264 [Temnothorax curvispinosus]
MWIEKSCGGSLLLENSTRKGNKRTTDKKIGKDLRGNGSYCGEDQSWIYGGVPDIKRSRQGCVMNLLLFNLYIADLAETSLYPDFGRAVYFPFHDALADGKAAERVFARARRVGRSPARRISDRRRPSDRRSAHGPTGRLTWWIESGRAAAATTATSPSAHTRE